MTEDDTKPKPPFHGGFIILILLLAIAYVLLRSGDPGFQ